ncbi:hypothetical protein DK37_27420 [Halomonas sp. SUBG004]|nr:hypothetical protein DK37_27420 [Halomonas sp. SUBG004]
MLKLVEKIACIATVTSDDYKVYERLFWSKEALLILLIDSLLMSLIKAYPFRNKKIIVVGNSGDVGNNHAEILDALSAKKDIK